MVGSIKLILPEFRGIVVAFSSGDSSMLAVEPCSACRREDRRQRTANTTALMSANAATQAPIIIARLTETEAPASLFAAEVGAAVDETNERGHPLEMQPADMYVH
jgi:hypothetical protein